MQRQAENASVLAEWLVAHPAVEKVVYPGLPSHAQAELAKKQMRMPGAMITFVVKPGQKSALERARTFLKSTQLFACAESLGGVESLIEHPAIMTHASIPPATRQKLGISDGLIRVSVGIEHVDDLRADLAQAFERAG
jgi:cystathionine beta-lyase/cystathionine gamma-synthase